MRKRGLSLTKPNTARLWASRAACQHCACHSTSAHGLSSSVNSSAAATSTLLPSWDAPGEHGCPVCAPRAPEALLQLPHPPGGAECACAHQNWSSSLSHSRAGAAQSLFICGPHSSQPRPCATGHSIDASLPQGGGLVTSSSWGPLAGCWVYRDSSCGHNCHHWLSVTCLSGLHWHLCSGLLARH